MTSLNGHEFVEIGEGLSCLGSGPLDPFAGERERPQRDVYVSPFSICRYPTTRVQIATYLRSCEMPFSTDWGPLGPDGWPVSLERYGTYPGTGISWELATEYCRWLSALSGQPVGLPTEAEWEKAARGGDDRIWPWGDDFVPELCNSAEGANGLCSVYDYAAGASPYGCLHMAGGVWEWCEDFYHAYSHQNCEFVDPVNVVPAPQRVVKGGSAFCTKEIVRPACRDWTNSYNQGGGDDGFRVCIRSWR